MYLYVCSCQLFINTQEHFYTYSFPYKDIRKWENNGLSVCLKKGWWVVCKVLSLHSTSLESLPVKKYYKKCRGRWCVSKMEHLICNRKSVWAQCSIREKSRGQVQHVSVYLALAVFFCKTESFILFLFYFRYIFLASNSFFPPFEYICLKKMRKIGIKESLLPIPYILILNGDSLGTTHLLCHLFLTHYWWQLWTT